MPTPETERLRAHNAEFRPHVADLAPGIHAAVGYSASNVTLVAGPQGSVIIDTSANPTDAAAILAAFGPRLVRPIHAILYTHNHPDHSGGATLFAEGGTPEIIAHRTLAEARPEFGRGMRDGGDAFGIALPPDQFINAGTQLEYGRATPHTRAGFLPPTRLIDGPEATITLAGIELRLLHTPGESPENLAVFLPATKTLVAGDDFYKSFPNLSPLRGLRLRPPEAWIASLERMIALGAHHLIPGHTRTISGESEIRAALTAYRDGIKSVLDQTLAGIARGRTPEELVQEVHLPPHLAANPYLQEYYGSVAFTVRGIYADYVGWFDGNPTHIAPLPPQARAARLAALAGGPARLRDAAQAALAQGDAQWAAELADTLLALDPGDTMVCHLKADALTALAERHVNATARNYCLTVAQALRART